MRIRVISLLALMLCVGAVLFPKNVYAACDKPPTILAWQETDALHIEASGGQNGVEAVYINDNRVSYNAVSNINLPLRNYAGTGRFISVYAVDCAGNKSNTIVIDNPYYVPPATMPPPAPPTPTPEPMPTLAPVAASAPVETVKPVETAPPSQGNTSNPFTPAGTGTTVDNATSGDGKEFFTISSADGNVFHLIIDKQRATENVYLLNAVTEDDLMALAAKNNKSGGSVSAIPTPEPAPIPTTAPAPTPEPPQTSEPQAAPPVKNNTGQYIILIIVVLGAGGVGYYFKIMKPRQQSPDEGEFDDEDLEMEDDPPDEDEYPDEDNAE